MDTFKKHMRNHEKAHEEVCPYCGKIYKHMATHFYAGSQDKKGFSSVLQLPFRSKIFLAFGALHTFKENILL
jgi:hypothetical protein